METDRYNTYFMDIAIRSSEMSYSRRKKVGAVFVRNRRILSTGFNGMPPNEDNNCEIEDEFGNLITKKDVIHAEENAIIFANTIGIDLSDSILYSTLSPCVNCAKLLIKNKIKTVFYDEEYRINDGEFLLKKHGINILSIRKEIYDYQKTQTPHNPQTCWGN